MRAAICFSFGPPRIQTAMSRAVEQASRARHNVPAARLCPDRQRPVRMRRPRRLSRGSDRRARHCAISAFGHDDFRQRPVLRQRRVLRQGEGDETVDHALELALAPAHVVDQEKARLAGKAGAFGDAGEERRQRRLPGARHHQSGAVMLGAQALRQRPVLRQRQLSARQIRRQCPCARPACNRAGARTGGGEEIDRPVGEARFQELHHRMAAHEIADPHVRDDQDRACPAGPGFPRCCELEFIYSI